MLILINFGLKDSDGYLTIQELNDFLTPDEKLASSPEHVELMKEIEGTHQSKVIQFCFCDLFVEISIKLDFTCRI